MTSPGESIDQKKEEKVKAETDGKQKLGNH
jgi:hypothetical protein